ncbi:MAG: DNA cytosine methyltransferase [Cyanobacteria bacterium P01_G01_bin.19]
MASSKLRPTAVDLFAGAGGMTLGFEQAGFDVLAAVEFDPIHASVHEYNFPFWTTICQSVTNLTGRDIREKSAIGDRDIDVVFGGPPCQGFSLMGKRNIEDERNSLVFHFVRLVLDLQPKFFVMENVKGMTLGKSKKVLQTVIETFDIHGYQIRENYQVLNAANYGVPQNRRRLFLIGCRRDFSLPDYPQTLTQPPLKKQAQKSNLAKKTKPERQKLPLTPNVQAAIGDIPEANQYSELKYQDWVMADYGEASLYASQLRGLIILQDDYAYPREYNSRLLTCSRRTRHTAQTIARFAATNPGKSDRISHFHRLDLNGLCNTLRAGTASNRGAYTSPRPIHPITPRCITVREAARLHSYPDWFMFHATKWHGFRQIGNSVPPLLAKAIAQQIINSLGISPSKPSRICILPSRKLLQFKMTEAENYHNLTYKAIARRIAR